MVCRAGFSDFSIRFFPVLSKLAPIDDATPESFSQRCTIASLSNEFVALRSEHNRDGQRLLTRLKDLQWTLRLSDNCLVSGAIDPPVMLLPVEAFGVAIDMAELEAFAARDQRRSLGCLRIVECNCNASDLFGWR